MIPMTARLRFVWVACVGSRRIGIFGFFFLLSLRCACPFWWEDWWLIHILLALQLNIFMVILLAIISIHAYYKLDRKETAQRYFFVLVLLTLMILILEILSVALNSGLDRRYLMAHKMVDTLGFTLTPLVPVFAIFYLCYNKYR